jgi:hypothetical protein
MITEAGSFWYALRVQSFESQTIAALAGTADTAKTGAQTALKNADNACLAAGVAGDEIAHLIKQEKTLREEI